MIRSFLGSIKLKSNKPIIAPEATLDVRLRIFIFLVCVGGSQKWRKSATFPHQYKKPPGGVAPGGFWFRFPVDAGDPAEVAYGWAGTYSSEPFARTVEGARSRPLRSLRRAVVVVCFLAKSP